MGTKILYFECDAGISADMALGALIGLGADADRIAAEVAKAVSMPFTLKANELHRNGRNGVDVEILVDDAQSKHAHSHAHGGGHSHTHSHDGDDSAMTYGKICRLIEHARLTPGAFRYALDIFTVLGKAEASVHGMALEAVAFHEVGSPASLIDIIGTAVAVDLIAPDKIMCGAVHDGQGTITCAHGVIPVPVPAVRAMEQSSGIPIVIDEDVTTEMVTPSGYAILNGLGAVFVPHIEITPLKTGYGFGKRDTGKSGAVRAVIGEEGE
jgi:uncharacterized protein (DUF111 family)